MTQRVESVTLPILFRSLYLSNAHPHKAHHALQKIRSTTWQHIKLLDVHISKLYVKQGETQPIYFESDESEQGDSEDDDLPGEEEDLSVLNNPLDSCGGKRLVELWQEIMPLLTSVASIKLSIDPRLLREHASANIDLSYYASLISCISASSSQRLGQDVALEVQVKGVYCPSAASPLWTQLWQHVSACPSISLRLHSWRGAESSVEDPFKLKQAGLVDSPALHAIHLHAEDEAQFKLASKLPKVTSIHIHCYTPDASSAAWECIDRLSSSLVRLTVSQIDTFPEILQDKRFFMPHLRHLELPEFIGLEGALKQMHLPALRYFAVTLQLGERSLQDDGDLTSTREPEDHVPVDIGRLQAVIQFDSALPSTCRKREYKVNLKAQWQALQNYLEVLAPLAAAGTLDLVANIAGHLPRDCMASGDRPITTGHGGMLASTFSPPIRRSLTFLQVEVYQDTAIPIMDITELSFESLTGLRFKYDGAPSELKLLGSFLSNMKLPALKRLWIHTTKQDSSQYVATLEECLPMWPQLRNIMITSLEDYPGFEDCEEYASLQAACRNKMPRIFAHRWIEDWDL